MNVKLFQALSVVSAMIGVYNVLLNHVRFIDLLILFLIAVTLLYIEKISVRNQDCYNLRPEFRSLS